jgi:ATP-binding cassette subfamily B protein
LDRLDEILKIAPEEKPEHPKTLEKITEINLKHVGFNYQSNDKPAVEGVNIHGQAGETIAFVGPSGAGKTTLIKLLVGLYKATSGKVLFNDIDLRELDMEKIRNKMGLGGARHPAFCRYYKRKFVVCLTSRKR